MKNPHNLARRNLWNSGTRIKASELFMARGDWGDSIRECREAIDFSLKALLHGIGIEIPKFQDLGALLILHKDRIPGDLAVDWDRISRIAESLKGNQESSPFGGNDFMTFGEDPISPAPQVPTKEEAIRLLEDVRYLASLGEGILKLAGIPSKTSR
jgi:hypothetical protein